MRVYRIFIKILLGVIALPAVYFTISLTLSSIKVNNKDSAKNTKIIYLTTNGVHLDIILPKEYIDSALLDGLYHLPTEKYFAFGWGNEEFYLNTPEWSDLTFKTAFTATFLKGPSLIHLSRYRSTHSIWIKIEVSERELTTINRLILDSFYTDEQNRKVLLYGEGYFNNDDFYKAIGNYNLFNTCNSWVNSIFKKSGLKACLWTPFDFGLLNKYK